MQTYYSLGFLILALVFLFDRKQLRIDFTAILKFTKFILICSAAALAIKHLLGVIPPLPPLSFGSLLMVWWEDLVFSLLSIHYIKKVLPNFAAIPVIIITSMLFGSGHMYQGLFAATILSLYPYFISYKYSKTYGYGTVMICHVIWDVCCYFQISALQALK